MRQSTTISAGIKFATGLRVLKPVVAAVLVFAVSDHGPWLTALRVLALVYLIYAVVVMQAAVGILAKFIARQHRQRDVL